MNGASGRTFVLIHGSWHGGWCWDRLRLLLEELGHRVIAPTLIGLGELAYLANRATGLGVHVDQVAALLRDEDVRDAVLVGHSYGGMILTAVAERAADRIAWLVYLDALLPRHGQSCFDLMPGVEAKFQTEADRSGDGWLVPPMEATELGVADPTDVRWVNEHLVPMPILTHQEKLVAPHGLAHTRRRGFILCKQFFLSGFAEQARAEGFDLVTSIDAGHDVQVTHPVQLRDILASLD